MHLFFAPIFSFVLFAAGPQAFAQAEAPQIQTIADYNQSLIDFGVSWKAGKSTYFPSFYTGFAPKIESANRIHFHLGRGNQARLTGTLDELAVLTYLYGLRARSEFYTALTQQGVIAPVGQSQVGAFQSILASPAYKINETIQAYESGKITREYFYLASLEIMKLLNPGRIFPLRFDLRQEFLRWKNAELTRLVSGAVSKGANDEAALKAHFAKNPKDTLVAVNNILFGRINTTALNDASLSQLAKIAKAQLDGSLNDDGIVAETLTLFHLVTNNRFDFKVVSQGAGRDVVDCVPSGKCDLVYTEMTAIYPVGSVKDYTSDRDGNQIPTIREVGSMNFVERSYHEVDHIREEGYYGWIPKMDYTDSGNGIHNPAVRSSLSRSSYKWLYEEFGIPKKDDTLWVVARGGVSHGCTRMAAGHVLEVRQIFPSNPQEMTKLVYQGNNSADYDLYDIDGSGQLKVMGVDYLIAYALDSDAGAGYREGNGFIDEALKKGPFYDILYGKKQFSIVDGRYVFHQPYISYFGGEMKKDRAKSFSVQLQGSYELYEQAYEKDKLQFYDLPKLKISSLTASGNNKTNKSIQLVRLFGRVNACGPFKSEFANCQEDAFRKEMSNLTGQLK